MKAQQNDSINRVGIFVFYDKDGIVDDYVYELLSTITPFLTKLVVVCNGKVEEKHRFNSYTDTVIVRENKGYDAGAYKDAITFLNSEGQLELYDELLLFNDTFFGFFDTIKDLFDDFEHQKDVSYYGITESEAGEWDGIQFRKHIQAYFLLIRAPLLHSKDFMDFWCDLQYARNYREAVFNFEIALSNYVEDKGYKIGVFCHLGDEVTVTRERHYNPYGICPGYLITHCKNPTLKIKSLMLELPGGCEAYQVLGYLKDNDIYDVDLIKQHLSRKFKSDSNFAYFDVLALEQFCTSFNKLYIYGAGKYGRHIKTYLEMRNIKYEKIIVSKKDTDDSDIIALDELVVDEHVGVIVALGKNNTKEVLPSLLKKVSSKHIYTGNYLA